MEKWIPADKKVRLAAASAGGGPGFDIPGIDLDAGLSVAGGSMEEFAELLRLFYADCSVRLGHFDAPPAREKLPQFVTAVHALKSSSGNVGAAGLSEKMRELEELGRHGAEEDVARLIPDVRGELHGLLTRLDGFLQAGTDCPPAGGSAGAIDLDESGRSMFAQLRGHVKRNEIILADELIWRMNDWDPDSPFQDRLARISYLIHLYDTEKAVSEIDGVLGG
jgi:HPt (histidine-containing phosphotransfer) domain-containing protein